MSYTRKFKRNYDKVNDIAAEQPKSSVTLSQRIVAAVTAAGFVLNPMAVFASTIIKADQSLQNTVVTNGNVTQVWADKVVGNAAVNVFDQYKVNAGHIANMYFKELNGKVEAQNLVNFVNSRIDVNGTVNAIQNSKIGGNMFFLSKYGMAVGKSGVINTGSLYVMTPTDAFMNNIIGADGRNFNEDNFKAQWGDGINGNITKMQIPVNASGTITVLGNINAANDVKMMAANISVGRNNTEAAIDGVAADGIVKEATIQTGVSDFSNIVNITDANGKVIVNAGLADNLTATVDKNSGDIVLRAVASDVNSNDSKFAEYKGIDNQAKATVVVDGKVTAAKDVTITAAAVNGAGNEKIFNDKYVQVEGDDSFTEVYGQLRKNVATVDINGEVTGKHVDIQANTINNYISRTDDDTRLDLLTGLAGVITVNEAAAYGVLANEATVNINKGAVITATAKADGKKALNISAESKLNASVGATTAAFKLANVKHTGNVPSAAVTYAQTDNKAAVNINAGSTLKSNGNTNISANADSTLDANAINKTTQLDGDPTLVNLGLLIATGKNASEVNIQKGAALTGTETAGINGDLTVKATSTNSVNTSALAAGKEASVASTAINVTKYDSSANVNIDADLTADNITASANNLVTKNNVTADNSVGANMLKSLVTQKVGSTKTVSDVKAFGSELKKKFFGGMGGGGSTAFDKVGEMIGVGASVSVAQESNTARVKIGSGAQITAPNGSGTKGDVNITANNIIADTQMGATGISSNYNDGSNQKVIINASVLYANMDNDATVEVSGTNEKGEGVKLTGKNVSVTASSEFQYNRVERMINDLLALCKKLENAYASNETYKKNVQELQKLAEDYKKNAAGNPDYLNSDDGLTKAAALATAAGIVGANASTGSVPDQIKDIVTGPYNVLGAVVQFANPDNYVNFRTGSSTGGKDNGAADVAVAGSANVTYLTNNSSVLIGKNTVIDAAEAADLKADVAQKDVSLVGKLLTGGGDTSIGGNVNLYFGDTNSLIVVGEGADITGGAINITSDNDINHTGVTYGAGKGGKTGVTGMVNVMQGDSNSLISIDDEATLTATGTETYDKDKDKVDTITGKKDGKINIKSTNNTTITNVAGTAAMADTAAVGIGVAVNMYNVNNKIAIADNDIDNSSDDEDKKAVAEILKANLSEKEREAVLGTAGVDKKADAEISGRGLEISVASGGTINAVGVAGSAVMGSDYDEPGIGDKFNAFKENMISKGEGAIDAIDGKIQGLFNKGGVIDGVGNASQGTSIPTNPNAGQKLPSFTVSGAGSNATNIIDGDTSSVIDGVTINIKDQGATKDGGIKAGAVDDSFVGAWAGSAAVNWKTTVTQQNWNNKSVGIAGAVAVNQADVDVKSIIKNTTINDAGNITNTAEKNGALVAAGIGGNFSKDASGGGGKKYTGAASVSVNLSENNVEAALENNTVANKEGKTNLTNDAYNNDTQVTGGVNANLTFGGDNANSIGAAVSVADITNTVTSKISGGTYTNMGDMAVNAVTDITQVGAAVGIGVSTAQDGNNLQGNAAYNKLTNNVTALVDGGAKIITDSIAVKAYDTDKGKKKHDAYINARGLDATGAEYQKNVSDAGYEDGDDIFNDDGSVKAGQTGNKIITAALSIAGSANKGNSGAAAVSINDINNDFTAKVNGATITANGNTNAGEADVDVHASSNTLMVNVAAGGAGTSQGFGGAGSVSWQTLNNDITAAIENSTITAGKTAVNAASGALGVNVAGQVAVGKNAAGLALAYNAVENNTGAYVKGSEIKNDNDEETELAVKAANTGKIYAVGAGVTAATEKIALNGSIAINRGNNNVEAIIDDYTDEKIEDKHTVITNAKKVEVATNDSSTSLAVVGAVTGGKKGAIGGAVAYNEIGNISGSGDDGKVQNNTAQIKNAQITAAKDAQISVKAVDTAKLTTAAVGVGVTTGGGAAVQGAAATALINKNTMADMTGVTITKANDEENGADVTVHASSDNNILTTADVASVAAGGNGAAIGAGVAVNKSKADVTASVNGGQQNVNNLRVDAANNAAIETIGVGGSVAGGTGAGITGSVAVNQIGNNTTAKIAGGAKITADNNVIVDAISDEQIANYAGALSVAAKGAAIGVSVSVNQIDGTTNALIEGNDTSVTAYAKGGADNVKDAVDDGDIVDEVINADLFKPGETLGKDRDNNAGSNYSGVAVSAAATHDLKSFLINAGGTGQGAAVNGTVNVNMVDGATLAAIRGADVISNQNGGEVNVIAHDYTNSAGMVGTANLTIQGAAVGLGSDTNTVQRNVSAQVLGKGRVNDKGEYVLAEDDAKNKIDTNELNVSADAKQGISSLTAGVSIAGEGAGVSNSTSVALLKGTTTAQVQNAAVTTGSLNVLAKHTDKINTMDVAGGIGGIGAGVGIGVSVLNEESTTEAKVDNTDVTYTASDKESKIAAENNTKVNYQQYNVGAGAVGAAGSIGVGNINSKVNTTVSGSNFGTADKKAGSITVAGNNTINFTNKSGTGAGGGAGIGVGVAVNTIDSQVNTSVANSKLHAAGDINVTAAEERNINQLAVNTTAGGAAAIGANVMITNIGKAIKDSYGANLQTDKDGNVVEGSGLDTSAIFDSANDAVEGNKFNDKYGYGVTGGTEAAGAVEAGKGSGKSAITVSVSGSTLDSSKNVKIDAVADTNVNMESVVAGGSLMASVNGTVGILNVHRNSLVNVANSTITAGKNVAVQSTQKGKSQLDIYQGTGGLMGAIGAAYGEANSSGVNNITITGGTMTGGNVGISAQDQSRTAVNAFGVTVGGMGAASVVVAEGTNKSSTTVNVGNDATINAENGDVDINAERKAKDEKGKDTASLSVNATAGSGGLIFAGTGVGATANEFGKVGVAIGSGNSLIAAQKVNVTALNAPDVTATTKGYSASLVASAAATVAEVNIGGKEADDQLLTYVSVGKGNTFAAGSGDDDGINIEAKADAEQTVDMEGMSIQAGMPGVAVQVNAGKANAYSTVKVDVADGNTFRGHAYKVSDVSDTEYKNAAVDVNIEGSNSVKQDVTAKGVSASTGIASGTNVSETNVQLDTDVNVGGSKLADESINGKVDLSGVKVELPDNFKQLSENEQNAAMEKAQEDYAAKVAEREAAARERIAKQGSSINNITVKGSSNADITNKADGSGGGLADISPEAAKVVNKYTADTDVNVGGSWNTAGAFNATAINGSKINLDADAVRAAVVGGSGVWLDNTIDNAADVNVKGAAINSDGKQVYTAQNNVDYTGDIKGSGYGGVTINGSRLDEDIDFKANVNIDGSTLTGAGDAGSITAQALTTGSINSTNSLKSAGVIPISVADSNIEILYQNAVNVNNNSKLVTRKKDQDITLSASDDTKVRLESIADTQGGLIGAASADTDNKFDRSNTISVAKGSYIESANDVNLYAGANNNGIDSNLIMTVLADAYNKTALPVCINPSITNNMTQTNTVDIAGSVNSVRHANLKAVKGVTTVTESAREYNIYTGTGGSGSVASTALHETIKSETSENKVNIADGGAVRSGIHNELDINIGGNIEITEPKYEGEGDDRHLVEEGKIVYDDSNITIGAGADWFNKDEILSKAITIINGYKERYDKIVSVMQQYNPNSDEYKNLNNELANLRLEMGKVGFLAKDENGKNTNIALSEIKVLGISLPDIVISGGNINIEADKLEGSGKLTAQGAPQLTVTNKSDLYLEVNDLTVKDAGGQIKFNEVAMSDSNKGTFSGNYKAEGQNPDHVPTITISSEGNSPAQLGKDGIINADINIVGDITNTAGNVEIKNKYYDIIAEGNISGRNITISAEQGSVTQTSSEGLVNIGTDPVTKYQLSEDVAKKVQEYIYKLIVEKREDPNTPDYKFNKTFNSYDEYKQWLIDEVGIDAKDLNFKEKPGAGIQAGGNVYISGVNVNIGGLVQSGYGDYSVNLDTNAQKVVDKIDAAWDNTQLADSDVFGNKDYLVSKGGKVWDQSADGGKGLWRYEVPVYYNPSTGQLLTDSVNTSGGQIHITGKISSTGNGRLMAMDGVADIDINTSNVNKDVKLGSITNSDISGLISITDKEKGMVTEYKNGASREYAINEKGISTNTGEWTANNGNMVYKPKEGTQYQWTGGVSGSETRKYSYSEKFLFWGALDYSKTDEFVKDLESKGKEITAGPVSSSGDKNLDKGVVIKNVQNGGQFSISGDYLVTDNEVYTDVVPDKQYDGIAGKIFGYGTTYYYWSGTKGSSSSTTSSLKADKDIAIGFIGSGDKAGNINVTSQKDMVLGGNISNAIAGKGSVSLTSTQGAVTSIGNATINSDDVNIKATTGVNVNHAAIGTDATVNVTTNTGDIQFMSDKGKLIVEKISTGVDPANGKVNNAITGHVTVQAMGDINNADTTGDYAVRGQRIDLESKGGAIDLTILAGNTVSSGNSMDASVNATAKGDIVLTQASGDMRLGIISSREGNVTLNADGSFIDAYNSKDSGYADTEDKVNNWIEKGLISKDDADSDSSEAAKQAKADRLEGLDERAKTLAGGEESKVNSYKDAADKLADALNNNDTLKAAKEAYVNEFKSASDKYNTDIANANGDEAKIAEINKAYTAEQQQIRAKYMEAQKSVYGDGFTADEQQLINSYAEVNVDESNFGWSRNQLLYAIQDDVLNGTASKVTEVANVTANNITLNAGKGVGIDEDAKKVSFNDLNNVDNLKLLASAKAGELKKGDNEFTVQRQQAINVTVRDNTKGQVKVTGVENVYVSAVDGSALNITDVDTKGDIRLHGDKGVQMVGDGKLKGNDLFIEGVDGNIGEANKQIITELKGTLAAYSNQSAYIKQLGDMSIVAVNVGKDAVLTATGNIAMDSEDTEKIGRITAGRNVDLTAETGNIGSAENGIRIENNGAVVNANAEKGNVYLEGENNGTLVLGKISGTEFFINSDGDVELGRAEEKDGEQVVTEAVEGKIEVSGSKADINASNIELSNGSVNIKGENGALTMTATGSITQDANAGGITANTVNATTAGSQQLVSNNNKVNNYNVHGLENDTINGSVDFVTSAAGGLKVQLGGENGLTVNNGNVSIKNLAGKAGVTVKGSVTTAGGTDAEGDVRFTSQGSLTNEGAINSANNVAMNAAGAITQKGSVTAKNNATFETTTGEINFEGDVTATTGNVVANTESGAINVNGSVNAGDNAQLTTGSDAITTTGDVTAGTDVNVTTGNGEITLGGKVNAETGNVNVHSDDGKITTTGSVTAKTDTTVTTGSGAITIGGSVTATDGKVEVKATGDNGTINTKGTVTAGTDVTMNTAGANGSITTGGAITAGNDVKVQATGENSAITLGGDVLAKVGEILAKTNTGSITVNGNATANTNVGLTSGSGKITTTGNVIAGTDVNVTTGNGAIGLGGNVTAETGKVTVNTGSGNIGVTGNVSAEKEAEFTVEKDGSITLDGTTEAKDINAKVNGDGNITFTGAVTSTGGNVTADVGGKGNIETGEKAAVKAEKDISFTTNKGGITTNSSLNAGNDVKLTTENGAITANGKVDAGNSVGLTTNTGDIVTNGAITAEKADVTLTTNTEGNITTGGAINAANNFTANTNTGDILFRGNVSAQQNINVNVNTKGNISTSDGEGDGHTGAKLEAINGNMNIQSKLGDIDMHELYAKNALDIIAEKGNINICDINGNIVTIVLKTPGTKQHVDHITAGSQIVLEGSDINLDEIDRRVGSDGMLIISPKGNNDQPMNEFNIGSLNSSGGIRLSQLWAKNSKINVLEGKFYIDKLFIENEAHFSRGDFTTAVYGKAPVDDGSNSIFWNNPKYNPVYNLDAWKAEGQNGFYFLNFEEHPYVQRSNMVLVHLDDYYYVYNQRFTGVNHARYLEGDGLYELYQLADEPSLVYYNRYYNYDLPEMAQNADEDELVIESEKV